MNIYKLHIIKRGGWNLEVKNALFVHNYWADLFLQIKLAKKEFYNTEL